MAEYTCHGCGERRIFGVKHVCFSRVALPSASLGDEERAEAWADQFSEPKTHGPAARLVAKASALWGLRTSRAELLAEREKVRKLRGALDQILEEANQSRHLSVVNIKPIAREALKETE